MRRVFGNTSGRKSGMGRGEVTPLGTFILIQRGIPARLTDILLAKLIYVLFDIQANDKLTSLGLGTSRGHEHKVSELVRVYQASRARVAANTEGLNGLRYDLSNVDQRASQLGWGDYMFLLKSSVAKRKAVSSFFWAYLHVNG